MLFLWWCLNEGGGDVVLRLAYTNCEVGAVPRTVTLRTCVHDALAPRRLLAGFLLNIASA